MTKSVHIFSIALLLSCSAAYSMDTIRGVHASTLRTLAPAHAVTRGAIGYVESAAATAVRVPTALVVGQERGAQIGSDAARMALAGAAAVVVYKGAGWVVNKAAEFPYVGPVVTRDLPLIGSIKSWFNWRCGDSALKGLSAGSEDAGLSDADRLVASLRKENASLQAIIADRDATKYTDAAGDLE